jgi:hypothetical protein
MHHRYDPCIHIKKSICAHCAVVDHVEPCTLSLVLQNSQVHFSETANRTDTRQAAHTDHMHLMCDSRALCALQRAGTEFASLGIILVVPLNTALRVKDGDAVTAMHSGAVQLEYDVCVQEKLTRSTFLR